MPHLSKASRVGRRVKKRIRKNPPFPAPTLHNLDTLPAPLGKRGGVIDSGGQESKAPIVS